MARIDQVLYDVKDDKGSIIGNVSISDVLEDFGKYLAATWLRPNRRNASDTRWVDGPELVLQDLYNLDFKDEFERVLESTKDYMGRKALEEFERLSKDRFPERSDEEFHRILKEKLAVSPSGDHIDGAVGKVIVGSRRIGKQVVEVETLDSLYKRRALIQAGIPAPKDERDTEYRITNLDWHVYAGEEEERERIRLGRREYLPTKEDEHLVDEIPRGEVFMANVPNIGSVAARAALDAVRVLVDEGTAAGYVDGRSGTQPADPDVATTGVRCFACEGNITNFFNAAADDGDGTCSATAQAISDDTSADSTNTLGYCRISSANSSVTELDAHIDGSVGTSGADFNFNTLSIVSGSTVSITSLVLGLSQGTTAT